jgi:type IV secretion system protein VirB4
MLHVDAVRVEASHYPPAQDSHFPDAVTRLMDETRRGLFESGQHYETQYVLVATYLPAKNTQNRATAMLFEGDDGTKGQGVAGRVLALFRAAVMELEDRLSSVLSLSRLQGVAVQDMHGATHVHDGLLQWLHYSLSGNPHPVLLPAVPMYLDAVIGGYDFWTGVVPRLGDKLIRVVGIDGFPQESYQGILAALDQLPIPYRWSTRFIFQDPVDAQVGLRKYRRKWQQQIRGFTDQVFRTSRGAVNQDAVEMVAEAESALSEASSGLVTYGYYTSVVVLMGDDPVRLDAAAREVKRVINNLGFVARVESVNAVEAWLGSLPGHALPNLRRPMMHTLQLAHLLPLSAVWAGRDTAPCPFYPPNSPPLLHAVTDGSTPFRLNLHVSDVGHTLILGPTGTGKSTLLGLLAASARRYPDASVFVFDKGRSMEALTRAVGGQHYDIAGEDTSLCFAPLANLHQAGEQGWAEDWVATLMALQGVVLTPPQRKELGRALKALAAAQPDGRTLTALQVTLQDMAMKDALHPYTISGALGQLLDAEADTLSLSDWGCFEIEHLMNRDDKVRLPVLLYLFHVLEKQMHGQPGFLFLDEAWLMLGHPVFRAKIDRKSVV